LAVLVAEQGATFYYHSETTGESQWDEPKPPPRSAEDVEHFNVVIPERAVPGMLLCVDVPNAGAKAYLPVRYAIRLPCDSRCVSYREGCHTGVDLYGKPSNLYWTPMIIPEGARAGMMYTLALQCSYDLHAGAAVQHT
jgi:hypothetical protein